MKKVLILDDNPENCRNWREGISTNLGGGGEVTILPKEEAGREIEMLLDRQLATREGAAFPEGTCVFDGPDILVVDYDLVHISEGHGRFTGEGICRLVHAYSQCGIVVVLNQFVEADFDLSQRGNPKSSHADLNVSSQYVTSNGLWGTTDWEDFRPWHWPVLPDSAERLRELSRAIAEIPDRPLLPLLGFDVELAALLSDDAIGFIHPSVQTIEELLGVGVQKFLCGNSNAADPKDGSALNEIGHPNRNKLAASRLTKWMRRMVVGPRNLIVDLPHLIERYPFLMPEDKLNDHEAWQELIAGRPDWLNSDLLSGCWVDSEFWSRIPHVWLPKLVKSEEFRDLRYEFEYSKAPDLVFAEDSSIFTLAPNAKQFKAEFHNEFDRRFVKRLDNVNYAPRRRFAL